MVSRFDKAGNWKFESVSLHRRVYCEPILPLGLKAAQRILAWRSPTSCAPIPRVPGPSPDLTSRAGAAPRTQPCPVAVCLVVPRRLPAMRSRISSDQPAAGGTRWVMAQMKPANSRAIAAVTTLAGSARRACRHGHLPVHARCGTNCAPSAKTIGTTTRRYPGGLAAHRDCRCQTSLGDAATSSRHRRGAAASPTLGRGKSRPTTANVTRLPVVGCGA